MPINIFEQLSGHGAGVVLGVVLGGLLGWLGARWRRCRERQKIFSGDARGTVVIHQHVVETTELPATDGSGVTRLPATLRIRSLGQAELDAVVPNGYLAAEMLDRAFKVTAHDSLISMEGPEGSYLLETLTNFICDRIANAPFEHDLYVMAACCEPAGLSEHQPITILLGIRVTDLAYFERWAACRDIQVEHGSDGARILTLMELAQRFRGEQEKIENLRKTGQRTRYVETMYVLDLALDRRIASVPVKRVPWGRYEEVLKQLNIE